ncbi:MAG: hypothetical protein DWI24_10940 [Planctomycetota bacterium]|nr:MAG: hypothetical protein DWI24_10940 [Planctomycetota bacterium]
MKESLAVRLTEHWLGQGRPVTGLKKTDMTKPNPARFWRALGLVSLIGLWLATGGASAQILQRLDPPAVDLAADRIQVWSSDPDRHWVILSGRVSIAQDGEGLRADEAVVLVEPGKDGYRLMQRIEVKAAGHIRLTSKPTTVLEHANLTFRSKLPVRLKPYTQAGMTKSGPTEIDQKKLIAAFGAAAQASIDQAMELIKASLPADPKRSEQVPEETPDTKLVKETTLVESVASPVDTPARDDLVVPVQATASPAGDDSPVLSNPLDNPPSGALPPAFDPQSPERVIQPNAAPPNFGQAPLGPGIVGGSGAPNLVVPGGTIPPALPEEPASSLPLPSLILGDAPIPLEAEDAPAEITPGTQRVVGIFPRDSSQNFSIQELPTVGQTRTVVIQGGVNMVMETGRQFGTVDLSADRIVLWITDDNATKATMIDSSGKFKQSNQTPLEVYLEGNVIYRMDERKVAGNGDERMVRAEKAYYDAKADRFTALQAELNIFAPGLLAPIRTKADRISQWREAEVGPDGIMQIGRPIIDSVNTTTTGSRFPNPGYRFHSNLVRLTQEEIPLRNPITGSLDPVAATDYEWKLDARQSKFYIGRLPIMYFPRVVMTPDDLEMPLKQIQFRTNNYFGQQVLSDWSMFKVLGMKRPKNIDTWNVDIDYLSARGPAVGSEIGYFGKDALGGRIPGSYFGYADAWTIWDKGTDVLGTGPAVITDGPPGAGNRGYQRSKVPVYDYMRGRYTARHMQSLLADDAPLDEDFRIQAEVGYLSDRYFLEQYYKRLYDTGLDQETSIYAIRQKENQAVSLMTKGNLQSFYTDTQWLPKLDYYRIADSWLGDRLTHYSHSGADYANVHTDVMVNNPTLFAFQPYDPISQTSGSFGSGRLWTSHELDMPVNLGALKLTPYLQGQAIGWSGQYNNPLPAYDLPTAQVQQLIRGQNNLTTGRLWGAAGMRANFMMWKLYNDAESEVLNVHGLNHKMNFGVDYRDAYSAMALRSIGVQDELDDNTYEFGRRYFAFTNYGGGVLPPQYNPLLLATRRNLSPITGTTDVLQSMQTVKLDWNHRLQTKRGPEGSRRIIDWMLFDVSTTYFPQAGRDNFGKQFGLNTYNWEWYVGDRTTVFSNGWFEFWDIGGDPLNKTNVQHTNDPFGMKVITSGFSFNRPPKGNATISYTILQTGEVNTSALNVSYSYWVSPKWYSTFSTSYDFGNAISLGSNVAVTRVGADYLTSIGLNVDPQRQSTMVSVAITPRLSPNLRLGQSSGPQFDSRFAPTQ